MIHYLPSYLTVKQVETVLNFCQTVLNDTTEPVICDASQLKFVDPLGLCILGVICDKLQASEVELQFINIPSSIVGYLARMDLFKTCSTEDFFREDFSRHNRQDILVEIQCLQERQDIDDCSGKIANAIVGKIPGLDINAPPDDMTGYTPYEKLTIPLQYMFSELLENSLTHGKRQHYGHAKAWVALQYYPSKDLIRLAIIDNGCGFLKSLYRKHLTTHIEAINLALEPRVTCNNTFYLIENESVNQGIGLTVVKEMVIKSQGRIYLASGDALLEVTLAQRLSETLSYWQGVLIVVELNREQLTQIDLLGIINSLREPNSDFTLRFE